LLFRVAELVGDSLWRAALIARLESLQNTTQYVTLADAALNKSDPLVLVLVKAVKILIP